MYVKWVKLVKRQLIDTYVFISSQKAKTLILNRCSKLIESCNTPERRIRPKLIKILRVAV